MTTGRDGRRERSEATRTRLLDAAAGLFAARGYEGASVEAIGLEAGVNKALIRYHFGGKPGLYAAILRDAVETGAELLEPVGEAWGAAIDRLEGYVEALGRLFELRPHFAPILVREWMSGGAHVEADVLETLLGFLHLDREILSEGARRGELRASDPHGTHLALVGALAFFHLGRPAGEPGGPPPAAYRALVKELLRHGLSAAPEPTKLIPGPPSPTSSARTRP